MNTQTHLLMAAALLAKPGRAERLRNAAIVAGALLPDLALYAMFLWSKLLGAPEREVWRVWYFTSPWQTVIDWTNSIPLYAALAALGLWFGGRAGALTAFGLAALIHIAGDLPLHTDDAHAHFLPLTSWRFDSGVSYWDRNAYGGIAGIIETALAVLFILLLWRRFRAAWVRVLLALSLAAFLVPALYFG